MMKLLESWNAGSGSFVENGQYLALFFAVLLFLWLAGGEIKKEFAFFSFVMALLLVCPLTARVLLFYQTSFFAHEAVWELLPLTGFLAYGMVMVFAKMLTALTREEQKWKATVSGKKEKGYEALAIGVLAAVLFLCGTVSLAESVTDRTDRADGLPTEAGKVLDLLDIPGEEEVLLAAPDEIVEWARLYHQNITLLYGRDIKEQGLTAYLYDKYDENTAGIHDWVEGALPVPELAEQAALQEEKYVTWCAEADCDYLIFTIERANNDLLAYALENGGYKWFAQSTDYVIYRRQEI